VAVNRALLKLITPDPCPIRAQYAPASFADIDPLPGTVPARTDSCTAVPRVRTWPARLELRESGLSSAFARRGSTDPPPRRPHSAPLPCSSGGDDNVRAARPLALEPHLLSNVQRRRPCRGQSGHTATDGVRRSAVGREANRATQWPVTTRMAACSGRANSQRQVALVVTDESPQCSNEYGTNRANKRALNVLRRVF
jgi:hypothetical protein